MLTLKRIWAVFMLGLLLGIGSGCYRDGWGHEHGGGGGHLGGGGWGHRSGGGR